MCAFSLDRPDQPAVLAMERCLTAEQRQFALVLGADTGPTALYLTNFFRWVFATDVELQLMGNNAHRLQRLVIQPMDVRALRYEAETFDFVSCSAAAVPSSLVEMQQAARELARVLKPGGVAVISVAGFSVPGLLEGIIDPSGCEPVEELAPCASGERKQTLYCLTLRKPPSVKSAFAVSPVYASWHRMQDEVIRQAPAYPADRFSGRGIVICAGGARLFTCAWVLVRMLREVIKTQLPIQVWYLGRAEMDPRMISLLERQGVETVNAYQCERRAPAQVASGWALKPFAILNSGFREVILLDADIVPLVDPALLLDWPQYADTGAVFWPDINPIEADCAIWDICRVPYRAGPAFESGQLLVDKARCWQALLLAMHMNEQADFYYRHILGDKDTFHMAFRMLNQPYALVPELPEQMTAERANNFFESRGLVLGQRDFAGNVIFQHRNCPKWVMLGDNPRYPQCRREEECLKFLAELATQWDGKVATLQLTPPPGWDDAASGARWFRYTRVSSDARLLEFLPDGRIGRGAGAAEKRWRLRRNRGKAMLEIWGEKTITCRLERGGDHLWRGKWLLFERMPVELEPLRDRDAWSIGWWERLWARIGPR